MCLCYGKTIAINNGMRRATCGDRDREPRGGWAHRQFESQIFAVSAANALSKHSAQNAVQIFTITLHKRYKAQQQETVAGAGAPNSPSRTHLSYLRHKSDGRRAAACRTASSSSSSVFLLFFLFTFFFVSLSKAI